MGIYPSLPSTVSCDRPSTASDYGGGSYTAPNCEGFWGWCNHRPLAGVGTILSVETSVNLYDCVVACSENSSCQSIFWDQGTCTLNTAWLGNGNTENVTSGVSFSTGLMLAPNSCTPATTPPTCPSFNGKSYSRSGSSKTFTVRCDADYAGAGDIGWSSQPTFQDCIDDCDRNPTCAAVVYSGTACYKKSTYSGSGTSGPGLQAAVLKGFTPAPTPDCPAADGTKWTDEEVDYTIHCGADYGGGDLTSTTTATFAGCISACTANSQCVDVSYVSGSCYLKSHLTTLTSSDGVWTAVRQNAANQPSTPASAWDGSLITCPSASPVSYTSSAGSTPVTFEIYCDTDYPGGDLSSLQTPTLQGCVDACATTPDCVGLAYLGVGCYLKSSLQPAVPNAGVIGVKAVSTSTSTSTS